MLSYTSSILLKFQFFDFVINYSILADPESPRNLTTTKVEETLLELTWHPPLQMNGNLLRYTLSYFPPDGCPDNSGSESAFIIEVCCFYHGQLAK